MLRHLATGGMISTLPGVYVGTVENVDDSEGLGRVQVSVPAVFGETDPSYSAWARPCFPFGHFFVPEVGTKIWVAFENGDPSSPVWMGIWYPQGEVPPEAEVSPPTNRVLHTPSGHMVQFDDDQGKVAVSDSNGNVITLDDQGAKVEDVNGNVVTLGPSGITLEDTGGNTVSLSSSGISLSDNKGATLDPFQLKVWLEGLVGVFNAWVPVPQDGGAALKTPLGAYLGSNPVPL